MSKLDRDYLERRAEEELDLAQQASHPAAVRAHYHLLGHYLDRLYPENRSGTGRAGQHWSS